MLTAVALAAQSNKNRSIVTLKAHLRLAAKSIIETRPTAINLFFGVDRVFEKLLSPASRLKKSEK